MKKGTIMKVLIIIAILVVFVILLFPRVIALNDGGTKIYKSLIFEVTKFNKIKDDSPNNYYKGTTIKIFGKEIYNNLPKMYKLLLMVKKL